MGVVYHDGATKHLTTKAIRDGGEGERGGGEGKRRRGEGEGEGNLATDLTSPQGLVE